MEDNKELVVIKILCELQEKYNINNLEVQEILSRNLEDYTLVPTSTEIMLTDLPEKINFFIGVKTLEGLAQKSLEAYESELNLLSKYIRKPVNQIDINDLRGYLVQIQADKKYAKITINNKIAIIKSFFGTLSVEEVIQKDPSLRLKKYKVDVKSLRSPLPAESLERLRNACKDIREKTLVELYFSTGCRLSEIMALNKSDINWNDNSIFVLGKGDKHRVVYFSVKCRIYLQEYLSSRVDENGSLFVSERAPHDSLGKSGIEKSFKKIANRAGISEKVSPHVMRHTYATEAVKKGMDIVNLSELMGHSSIETTLIYAKVNKNKLKSAYEQYIA